MLANKGTSFGWTFSNFTTPSATPGTSVTPGASNAEGAWTQVATAANMAFEAKGVFVMVAGGSTSANQKDHLLDIGVDPAGGTSYTAIISNVLCSQSQAVTTGGCQFYFPIRIPAGASVAVRVQGNNATAGTVRVCTKFFGRPSVPHETVTGQYSETIGTVASSAGVSFTPGNAAEGSWATLGTTTKDLWWWQLGIGVSAGTITAQYTLVDLAYGDATNKTMIIENKPLGFYGTAEIAAWTFDTSLVEGMCFVPAGSTLYVRGHCSTAPTAGYTALAVGIGG